jgi:hypothetical protein
MGMPADAVGVWAVTAPKVDGTRTVGVPPNVSIVPLLVTLLVAVMPACVNCGYANVSVCPVLDVAVKLRLLE